MHRNDLTALTHRYSCQQGGPPLTALLVELVRQECQCWRVWRLEATAAQIAFGDGALELLPAGPGLAGPGRVSGCFCVALGGGNRLSLAVPNRYRHHSRFCRFDNTYKGAAEFFHYRAEVQTAEELLELDRVAAFAAAKAVIEPPVGRNLEGWRLFLVEGAECPPVAAALLEGDARRLANTYDRCAVCCLDIEVSRQTTSLREFNLAQLVLATIMVARTSLAR